ncbi:MAG: MFS transporter [Chloroflexi bacterium]|nr:MFS transporter [Chloroflexota bacterium]MCI0795332.1 MFS transporter [Chloroflexota bacterium]
MTSLRSLAEWRPRTPFFYGWLILGMSALGTYAASGSAQLVLGGIQNFIFEDMGWDRSTIAYAVTAGTWTSGFLTPFIGRMADKYGPRGLMPSAALIGGVAFLVLGGVQSVWQFYAAYIVARAIPNPILVGVVPRTAAVNFFRRRRNLALGISAMARPFGGAINIQVFSLIANAYSWRTAYRVHGLIALAIVLPLLLVMRRRPSDIGLEPDGDEPQPDRSRASGRSRTSRPVLAQEFSWTSGEAALTSAFWLVVIAESLVTLTSGTINFQIVPYLRDSGASVAVAAAGLSLSSLLGSLGNPLWGHLSDRFSPRRMVLGLLSLTVFAVALFLVIPNSNLAFAAIVFYGTVAGGLNILGNMMIAQYFGRASFGAITGLVGPFQTGALGLGPTLGALIFAYTGGYTWLFAYGVVAYIGALICMMAARPPKLPRRAIAEGFVDG